MEEKKKCQNCVNRFICPTYKENECCMGYNDEKVFETLLKMIFGGLADDHIDRHLKKVRIMQGRE